MSLNDLANIGQVIGALAVVISLIYVAFQIRQNTSAIRSATAQSVHDQWLAGVAFLAVLIAFTILFTSELR